MPIENRRDFQKTIGDLKEAVGEKVQTVIGQQENDRVQA
jgi:hypothetical protein